MFFSNLLLSEFSILSSFTEVILIFYLSLSDVSNVAHGGVLKRSLKILGWKSEYYEQKPHFRSLLDWQRM